MYMEVIVGEEEAPAIQEVLDDSSHKSFAPVAWAAAYGKTVFYRHNKLLWCYVDNKHCLNSYSIYS